MVLGEASFLGKSHEPTIIASGEHTQHGLRVLTTSSNMGARLFASFGWNVVVEIDDVVSGLRNHAKDGYLGPGRSMWLLDRALKVCGASCS
jgi:hypothetical protein